jgi:hypothetical protein
MRGARASCRTELRSQVPSQLSSSSGAGWAFGLPPNAMVDSARPPTPRPRATWKPAASRGEVAQVEQGQPQRVEVVLEADEPERPAQQGTRGVQALGAAQGGHGVVCGTEFDVPEHERLPFVLGDLAIGAALDNISDRSLAANVHRVLT